MYARKPETPALLVYQRHDAATAAGEPGPTRRAAKAIQTFHDSLGSCLSPRIRKFPCLSPAKDIHKETTASAIAVKLGKRRVKRRTGLKRGGRISLERRPDGRRRVNR